MSGSAPVGGASVDIDATVVRGSHTVQAALAVPAGSRVAVMGPNGAGKSTLLRAIAGLDRVSAGRIAIGERDVSAPGRHIPAHRRRVALLGQDAVLFPHLSVRENVAFGPRAAGLRPAAARALADAWLVKVGLDGLGDRSPAALSGGQRQRAALARALAVEPAVLLLDEPLRALDPAAAAATRALARTHVERTGITLIVVTHDVTDAAALADRLVVLEEGVVTHDGALPEVLAAPASPFAAGLAGATLLTGRIQAGRWRSGSIEIPVPCDGAALHPEAGHLTGADDDVIDEVVVAFPAGSVRLAPPHEASATATIARIEQTSTGLRVWLADPPLAADLAREASAWTLRPGDRIGWTLDVRGARFLPHRPGLSRRV